MKIGYMGFERKEATIESLIRGAGHEPASVDEAGLVIILNPSPEEVEALKGTGKQVVVVLKSDSGYEPSYVSSLQAAEADSIRYVPNIDLASTIAGLETS